MILGIVLAALAILLIVALVRAIFRPVVVYEFERGLPYARGKFTGVLHPGLYWSVKHLSEVRKVDIRPVFESVAGQEVLGVQPSGPFPIRQPSETAIETHVRRPGEGEGDV